MFGLFKPRSPLDIRDQVWAEERMRWLVDQFGLERMLTAEFVLPTSRYFPEGYEGTRDNVRTLLDRVCAYMQVDARRIDLTFSPDDEMPHAAGTYERKEENERATIRIAESQLGDEERLIATLAHEVAHDLLLGDGRLTGSENDHEHVTDLLTAFLGMGIFAANTTVQQKNEWFLARESWTISRQGYLPARIFGYVFALMAWVRGERSPSWAAYLGADALGAFEDGLKYVTRNGDTLFLPDSLRRPLPEPSPASLLADLKGRSDCRRIAALWDLRANGFHERPATELVVGLLRHRNRAVCCEAATTLSLLSDSNEEIVRELMAELRTEDGEFRAHLLAALGRLRPPLETVGPDGSTWREELQLALADPRRTVAHAAAGAAANYGPACGTLAPLLVPALKRALTHCNYEQIDFLLRTLTAILTETEAFLREHLAIHDAELYELAVGALRQQHAD